MTSDIGRRNISIMCSKLGIENIIVAADIKKKRDSNIVWMNDKWIYKEIQPYIHQANINAGWNFEWDWSESCQFTKYKLNQYIYFHENTCYWSSRIYRFSFMQKAY